jgi:hypothetical protein
MLLLFTALCKALSGLILPHNVSQTNLTRQLFWVPRASVESLTLCNPMPHLMVVEAVKKTIFKNKELGIN